MKDTSTPQKHVVICEDTAAHSPEIDRALVLVKSQGFIINTVSKAEFIDTVKHHSTEDNTILSALIASQYDVEMQRIVKTIRSGKTIGEWIPVAVLNANNTPLAIGVKEFELSCAEQMSEFIRQPVKINMLLIEDQEPIAEVIQDMLEDTCKIEHCLTGEQGLECFEHQQYDVVLLDLMLPNMHGGEVLKHMKTVHPEQVVIAMTAYDSDTTAFDVYVEGATEYIIKPFDSPEALLEKVSDVVRQHCVDTISKQRQAWSAWQSDMSYLT